MSLNIKLEELLFSEARKSDVVEFRKANNIWLKVDKKLRSLRTYGAFASFFNKDAENGYFHSFNYKELDSTVPGDFFFEFETEGPFDDVGSYLALFSIDNNVPVITLNLTKQYNESNLGTSPSPEEYNEWFMVNVYTAWHSSRGLIIHELTHYLNSLNVKNFDKYFSRSYDYNDYDSQIEWQQKVVKTYRSDMMKATGTRSYEKKKQKFENEQEKLQRLKDEFNVKYHNDPFELNAHFRQAAYSFVRVLMKSTLPLERKQAFLGNSPQEFANRFSMVYNGWKYLIPDNQKKILSRAAQLYDTLKQKYLK